MRNRIIGFLIIGIALLIGFIVYSFNKALTDVVSTTCSHGEACTMWDSINLQTNISIGIMLFIVAIGIYLIFFGKEEKIITKVVTQKIKPRKLNKKDYDKIMKKMTKDEKHVFRKIIESDGTVFQADLVDKTKFSKVKVSRILDRLEGKNLIERKRRGMTNMVILKTKH